LVIDAAAESSATRAPQRSTPFPEGPSAGSLACCEYTHTHRPPATHPPPHAPYTRSPSPPPAKVTDTEALPGRDPGAGGPHASPVCCSTTVPSLTLVAVMRPVVGSEATLRLALVTEEGEVARGARPPSAGNRIADRGGSTMAPPGGANRTRTPPPSASSCTMVPCGAAAAAARRPRANAAAR
jgi:hypothetical protein